jgi:hypothetical protein
LEAQLRLDFNVVFGLRPDGLGHLKKKSKMKERFVRAGVEVAQGQVVKSEEDAVAFVKRVGYPVILKPNIGVGAKSTYTIHTDEDLLEKLQTYRTEEGFQDLFIEEYIEGRLVTFDGLVDRHGNILFYTSQEHLAPLLEAAEGKHPLFYSYTVREVAPDLVKVGHNLVREFELRERFFHFELFRRRKNDALVGLEINARPPGGFTVDNFNFGHDIDLYRLWARMITIPLDPNAVQPPSPAHHPLRSPSNSVKLTSQSSHHDQLRDSAGRLIESDQMKPILANYHELDPLNFTYERPYFVTRVLRRHGLQYQRSTEEILESEQFAPNIVIYRENPPGMTLLGDYFFSYRTVDLEDMFKFIEFCS